MVKIFYPENWSRLLLKYQENFHHIIRKKYKEIYFENIDEIIDEKKTDFERDLYKHETHSILLSSALYPFLTNQIDNYQLLFIEPLKYQQDNHKISRDIPILDFILAEIEKNNLTRLIFGEVKSQKAGGNVGNIDKIISYYNEEKLLNLIYNNIRNTPKRFKLNINEKRIIKEFVLVVQNLHIESYINSICDRRLPFDIWEIRPDINRKNYKIKVHRKEKLLKMPPKSSSGDRGYSTMLNSIINKDYYSNEPFQFTSASDLDIISFYIYNAYLNIFGNIWTDDNILSLINELGGGQFYDNEKVLEDLLNKIKERFYFHKILKKEKKINRFVRRNLKEKIVIYRVENYIKKEGKELFEKAIQETKPKLSIIGQTGTIEKWLN